MTHKGQHQGMRKYIKHPDFYQIGLPSQCAKIVTTTSFAYLSSKRSAKNCTDLHGLQLS